MNRPATATTRAQHQGQHTWPGFDGLTLPRRQLTGPGAGPDQPLHPCMEKGRHHGQWGIHAAIKNGHFGPLRRQGQRREGNGTGPRRHRHMHPAVIHPAQGAHIWALKGTHTLGGHLGDSPGSVDLAIHHHQHPVTTGLRATGHLHRLKQIQRTIGTERCSRTHRSHQHHGPRIINE